MVTKKYYILDGHQNVLHIRWSPEKYYILDDHQKSITY